MIPRIGAFCSNLHIFKTKKIITIYSLIRNKSENIFEFLFIYFFI